jgi:acetoin utilization protein AcuB
MSQTLVRELMDNSTATINPGATLADAARLMADQGIRRLPIVENDGSLVGIITARDIQTLTNPSTDAASTPIDYAKTASYPLNSLTVVNAMTPNPIVVSTEASAGEAARLMLAHNVSGLLVVDGSGKLAGSISFTWGQAKSLSGSEAGRFEIVA